MPETKWDETRDADKVIEALRSGLDVQAWHGQLLGFRNILLSDSDTIIWESRARGVFTVGHGLKYRISIPAPKPEFVDCKVEPIGPCGDLRVINTFTNRRYGLSDATEAPGFAGYLYFETHCEVNLLVDSRNYGLSAIPRITRAAQPALTPAFVRFYAV